MEKVSAKSSISQAKVLGTLISITGAFVVVFYKGPAIVSTSSHTVNTVLNLPQESPHSQWVIGGTLLATEYLLLAIWYIVQVRWFHTQKCWFLKNRFEFLTRFSQTKIIKMYPSEPIIVLLYTVSAMLLSIPVCVYGEPNLSAWKLSPDLGLAAIVYSVITSYITEEKIV